ncbi:hypothetical protein [uncultured Alcanivorax sp.]|uniref:hypothetical protein n=1 Tax=uncultured Alcanivorax sp. TaxID=191215 RepID=UPI0026361223|nr:hypothetical protein [uncultured Alcanivorax sp.]
MLLAAIRRWFSEDFYVQIHENRYVITSLDNPGESRRFPATDAFSTSRLLVGHFLVAETLLRATLGQMNGGSRLKSYRLIMHPRDKAEGGLCEVETRVLQDLAFGAGAHDAIIWEKEPLSATQAKALWDNPQ